MLLNEQLQQAEARQSKAYEQTREADAQHLGEEAKAKAVAQKAAYTIQQLRFQLDDLKTVEKESLDRDTLAREQYRNVLKRLESEVHSLGRDAALPADLGAQTEQALRETAQAAQQVQALTQETRNKDTQCAVAVGAKKTAIAQRKAEAAREAAAAGMACGPAEKTHKNLLYELESRSCAMDGW